MKSLFILLLTLPFFAYNQNPHEFVVLSGQITDQSSDSLLVRSRSFSKTIHVYEDGTFWDTFQVTTGVYNLYDGHESTNVFLKNGYDLYLTLDTKEFDETITYTGTGAKHSNFLAKKSLEEERLLDFDALSEINDLDTLESALQKIRDELKRYYTSDPTVDTLVTKDAVKNLEPMLGSYSRFIGGSIALKKELPKGSTSPVFTEYENVDGTTTSLTDLQGKYVYIDVWATWCGPCKAEIPFLKEIEEAYHNRNIHFVSLSVDDDRTHSNSWDKAREDWKNMIEEKGLGGIQLFAPEGWKSDFVTAYKIKGIPRFILIDPKGNVVTPDAPKPSNPKLKTLFESLKI
ncbi:MAG: TlpA family protein disulfide reductase [Saprospiraceae bacterium]|nr:TlpA family protein disulfide reductase [Saprospiraceae bacterium]